MEAYKEKLRQEGELDEQPEQQEIPEKSKLLRELVDTHRIKGTSVNRLSRKKLLRAMHLLLTYIPFLEHTLRKNDIKTLDVDIGK